MKITLIINLFLLTSIFNGLAARSKIRAFETDLCTGYKNKNKKYNWSSCCVEHDLYYWAGGSRVHRRIVDKQFKKCIRLHSTKANATIMYMGVKLGSLSPIKIKGKQWGNAWGNKVRKNKLSKTEKKSLLEKFNKTTSPHLTPKLRIKFVKRLTNK
ncbi:hypothetical protein N9N67_02490 [Bacteriovoracaceae bacterium]|nr:hypothetical protein [Bacteriovoracaceae bacterium]